MIQPEKLYAITFSQVVGLTRHFKNAIFLICTYVHKALSDKMLTLLKIPELECAWGSLLQYLLYYDPILVTMNMSMYYV